MIKKYFFSVNLLIRSDTNIKKSINSIIGNEKFFKENIQLILIDAVGSELSTEICTEYSNLYPDNVYFVDAVGEKSADSYNHAAPLSSGTYIVYTDNYGTYSKNTFHHIYNMIKSGRVPVFCIKPMVSSPLLPDRPYTGDPGNGTIHIQDIPDKFILMLGCYFFNSRVIKKISFDNKLRFNYDTKFMLEALMRSAGYYYSDKFTYTVSHPTERDPYRYEQQYNSAFYTRSVKEFIIPMLKAYAGSAFIMSVMMYLIEVKFALNSDDYYKKVLVGSRVKEFLDSCSAAFKFIDDTVITNPKLCRMSGLDEEVTFRFLRMKYNNPKLRPETDLVPPGKTEIHKYIMSENSVAAIPLSGEFTAHVNNVLITRSKNITAEIMAVNFDRRGIYIDARLNGCSCLNKDEYSVYSVINGVKAKVIPSEVYTMRKFFGKSFLHRYAFRFFIPVSSGKKIDTACLYLRYKKLAFRLKLCFGSPYAKLSDEIKSSYASFGDRILTYDRKSKTLVIRRTTESLLALSESRFLNEAAKNSGLRVQFEYRRIRRLARYTRRKNENKKIIMFYDNAGINYNGNLLFRYFSKNKSKDFEPYICVRRDSPEYNFLHDAAYDNILETGTLRAKVMTLAADILFASDCDPYDSIGFNDDDKLYLRDMMTAMTISVKNYFMTYDSAQYNNRLRDNTQMVFCSSEREKENLLQPLYDYNESMIKVTGSAMLDAVSNKREKLILIAPGRRRLFSIYENSGYYKFSESAFFKAYYNILSNKELLSSCKVNNWKIAVMMPPAIEKYMGLLPSDSSVKLYSYSEQTEAALLGKAAVLITDYNELQFRFAYMGKSVIYFYPPGLPINSEHKGENITRYGFGEVFFEVEPLCRFLSDGMDNAFTHTEKFHQRCSAFFSKQDRCNCKRIYEATMKLLKSL